MKNTFNLERKKVNGKFPYILQYHNGEIKYLFEFDSRTFIKEVIAIQKTFEEHQVVFATTDLAYPYFTSSMDAANPYLINDSAPRVIYFFKDGVFYESIFYKSHGEWFIIPTEKNISDTFHESLCFQHPKYFVGILSPDFKKLNIQRH